MTGSSPASGFGRAREVALVFLRLGVVAFGGPAAHTAMMRQELVQRRKWLTDERFVDLMGATNLIPGPNSTELAIHLGHERARWRGLLLAGVLFILPAAVIVTVLAWLYVEHGTRRPSTACSTASCRSSSRSSSGRWCPWLAPW